MRPSEVQKKNFSELKKLKRFSEVSVMDFTRRHSELPNQPILCAMARDVLSVAGLDNCVNAAMQQCSFSPLREVP